MISASELTQQPPGQATPWSARDATYHPRRTVLVVDDDPHSLTLMAHFAKDYADEVLTASNGVEALEIISDARDLDAVLLDVQMPGLTGLEVTREVREHEQADRYTPILLVTGNSDLVDVVAGFDAGADDYLVKPPAKAELASRLRAVFRMRDALEAQRRAAAELSDQLRDARHFQVQALPPSTGSVGPLEFAAIYKPYRFVGGDVFNYFRLSDNAAGFFVADISGHGAGAAMWSMWVSRMMSPGPGGLAKETVEGQPERVRPPSELCAMLDVMIGFEDSDKYFTAFTAEADWRRRTLTFCQAGHPPAILVRPDGEATMLESEGAPVGFELGLPFTDTIESFEPGDRAFIYSDCVTETFSPGREQFGQERLLDLLVDTRQASLNEQLQQVVAAIDEHRQSDGGLDDDLTLLGIHFAEET